MNVISKVAEDNNIQVVFVNNTETLGYGEKNGFRTPEGKIVLALNNQGGLMTAYFGHELCHDLEGTSAYTALESEVMKYLAKTYGDENLQKRIDGIMQSQNLSEQSPKAEIVANSCMTVFDENFITNFAKTHTKEARTIKDWFNRLVARIRQAMDKVKKYVTEYRAISDDVAEVERIRDLFNAALGERNANVKQNNGKETNENIQHSDKLFKNALTSGEWKKYNNAMATGIDAGIRISDTAMLIEGEKGEFNYKLVFYDNTYEDYPITAVYGIGEAGFREDITSFDAKHISDVINALEEENYADKKIIKRILGSFSESYKIVLRRYGDRNAKAFTVRPKSNTNSQNNNEKSNGARVSATDSRNLKFSVKQPIEETKDLIAIHNTTEEKLLSALELGGLPSPSIAIMKAENTRGNNDFGNISLVFDKSTIDPQADTANKVYSSDAYTPITVRAEHKLNEDKAWDVYSKIRELSKQKLAYNLNPTSFHPDNLKSSIDSAGGINELIDSYKNDYAFKELYLADTAEPRVIEAYLNIENPVIIDDGGTFFDYDEGYDFETEEYTDEPR